jgi:hypothetical protein
VELSAKKQEGVEDNVCTTYESVSGIRGMWELTFTPDLIIPFHLPLQNLSNMAQLLWERFTPYR